jgi:hypothetical protein
MSPNGSSLTPDAFADPSDDSPQFDFDAEKERIKPKVMKAYLEILQDPTESAKYRLQAADSLAEILGWTEKVGETPPAPTFSFNFNATEALKEARNALKDEGQRGRESQLPPLPTSLGERRAMERGSEEGESEG